MQRTTSAVRYLLLVSFLVSCLPVMANGQSAPPPPPPPPDISGGGGGDLGAGSGSDTLQNPDNNTPSPQAPPSQTQTCTPGEACYTQNGGIPQAPTIGAPGAPVVCAGDNCFRNPLKAGSIAEFLDTMLNALILILFPFIILFFVYGAFKLITAQGNEAAISTGRKALLWTTIGALIILGAKALTLAISGTVNEIRNATVEAPHPHLSGLNSDGVSHV